MRCPCGEDIRGSPTRWNFITRTSPPRGWTGDDLALWTQLAAIEASLTAFVKGEAAQALRLICRPCGQAVHKLGITPHGRSVFYLLQCASRVAS